MNWLQHTFLYFYHQDKANASIHLADVKFSPITFALADEVIDYHDNDNPVEYTVYECVLEVNRHKGQYEMDPGR